MGEKYNGLEKDLKLFAKFVFIYETNCNIFKANELNKFCKPAAVFFKETIKPHLVNTDEETSAPQKTLLIAKSKKSCYCFCRNLRNSIAHFSLRRNNRTLYFKSDKSVFRGQLKYIDVKKFILFIINAYENKETE